MSKKREVCGGLGLPSLVSNATVWGIEIWKIFYMIMSNIQFFQNCEHIFPYYSLSKIVYQALIEEKIGATGQELTKLADTSLGSYSYVTNTPCFLSSVMNGPFLCLFKTSSLTALGSIPSKRQSSSNIQFMLFLRCAFHGFQSFL